MKLIKNECSMSNKAIYQPKGAAKEYSEWACNFYVGCSNGCEYCYLRKGRGAKILGGCKPTLKKCFKDEEHAIMVFHEEMRQNSTELKEHGLFFSFTTDPFLPETIELTIKAMYECANWGIPVQILSKVATQSVIDVLINDSIHGVFDQTEEERIDSRNRYRNKIAIGFTLTGHDELEKGASTNGQRIEAMKKLHNAGFRTFASIEPVIDFEASLEMIRQTIGYCDLYKIGLESGKKYDKNEMLNFASRMIPNTIKDSAKVYFKDGILKSLGWNRDDLPAGFVNADYNIFQ